MTVTVTITSTDTGAAARFDRDWLDGFKANFPRARWNRDEKLWHVKGKTARRRIEAWAAGLPQESETDRQARKRANWEHYTAKAAELAEGRDWLSSQGVLLTVRTPYDPRIVAAAKRVSGARWDKHGRVWVWTVTRDSQLEQIDDAIAMVERCLPEAREAAAERKQRIEAEREQADEARRRDAKADAKAEAEAAAGITHWYVEAGARPVGETMVIDGQAYRVIASRAEQVDSSFSYPGLGCRPDMDEEWVTHLTLEPDTSPAGAAALAQERATVEAIGRRDAASARVREVIKYFMSRGTRPERAGMPDGEVLLELNRAGRILGAGEAFVIVDGLVWYVHHNSMDGDDWGRNNLPGAIGWHLPADEPMVEELRQLAHDAA